MGWLGAVAVFLALAVAGLTLAHAQMARAAYLAMAWTTGFVIVPLAVASLLTGLAVSLGTPWGLFHHYWVVAKLAITILATILLLVHTQPIDLLAAAAREATMPSADLERIQIQLVGDAAAALLALLLNVALSTFKPWGLTPYGLRKRGERPLAGIPSGPAPDVRVSRASAARTSRWVYVVGIHAVAFTLLFFVVHLVGGGGSGH